MSLILQGKIESIIQRKNKDTGVIYARTYQFAVETKGGYKKYINVDDFDLKRVVAVGQEKKLFVYVDIWEPTDKDGKRTGEPRIQYHAMTEEAPAAEEQKKVVRV